MSTFKSRAIGYASNIGGVNMEKVIVYAGIGFGLYLAYKAFRVGKAVTTAITSTGGAIGRGTYDLFHPNSAQQITSTDFVVWFPPAGGYPGEFHSVNSLPKGPEKLTASGQFVRNGVRYQLVSLKTPQVAPNGRTINKVAIRE